MNPTTEQIAKLPKWAQEHIETISRERELAVRSLNQYCDESTPSPFSTFEYVCTGEIQGPSGKRRYIQAIAIEVEWRGVTLRIDANDYGNNGKGIRLQWGTKRNTEEVAFIPTSYQAARILTAGDMS